MPNLNSSISLKKNPDSTLFLARLESFLKQYWQTYKVSQFKGHKVLWDAIYYSLFSGGKRFRPLLIHGAGSLFSLKPHHILPWAGAIEFAHTASLIHDDLPLMDASLSRRGKATTHRVFGSDIALLAGDTLWMEAFKILMKYKPPVYTSLSSVLLESLGFYGMMGGQALDLKPHLIWGKKPSHSYYQKMSSMKTGALMAASLMGAGILSFKTPYRKNLLPPDKKTPLLLNQLKDLGYLIGLAFQLEDDLIDFKENKNSNYTTQFGIEKTKEKLKEVTEKAFHTLSLINPQSKPSILNSLILRSGNKVTSSL